MAAGVWDKVTFMQQLVLLNKATSDDESPTPGYLYRDIIALTFKSSSYCNELIEFLVQRMDEGSFHVKLKVLKILQLTLEKGHPEFKQGLRRRSKCLQEATVYNGPPDPLHGNTPYIMIRNTAKLVNQMLFETDAPKTTVQSMQHVEGMGSSQGIGSTQGMGGSQVSSNMQGFGNTPFTEKSLGDSIISGMLDLAEKVLEPSRDQPNPALVALDKHFGGQYKPITMATDDDHDDIKIGEQSFSVNHARSVAAHRPGVAGGGWDDAPMATFTKTTGSSNKSTNSLEDRLETASQEDWNSELDLVNSIVVDQQTPIPSRTQLQNFILRCASVNCDKVLEFINLNLQKSDKVNTIMRCLLLLEQLMRSDLTTPERLSMVFHSNLTILYSHKQRPIQAKTKKIILLLKKLTPGSTLFDDILNIAKPEISMTTDTETIATEEKCLDSVNIEANETHNMDAIQSSKTLSANTAQTESILQDLSNGQNAEFNSFKNMSISSNSTLAQDDRSHAGAENDQGSTEITSSPHSAIEHERNTIKQREGSHDSISSVDSLEQM